MNSTAPDAAGNYGTNIRFWAVLWAARTRIALVALACGLAAAALAFTAAEEWEASGVVRLARIGEVRQSGVVERVWVEPPPLTTERLAMSSFQNSVLQSLGRSPGETSDDAELYRKSLRGRLLANAEVIQVKVRGRTPEASKQLLEATVRKLSEIHEELAAPAVQRSREQLVSMERRIADLDRERVGLHELLARAGADKSQVATTIYALDAERREIAKQRSLLEDQFRADRRIPTSLIDAGYVPGQRAFPRRGLIIITGLLIGLGIGVVWALVRAREAVID